MPSSGKNPFDDGGDNCSGGGGGEVVVNNNPFDDDCEESSGKTAPSGDNPFDSDDSSYDSIGIAGGNGSNSQLGKNPFDNESDELERTSLNSETHQIYGGQVLPGNNPFDNTSDESASDSECGDNSHACERESSANSSSVNSVESAECDGCSESNSEPDEYSEGDEEAQVLHQTILDSNIEAGSQQAGDKIEFHRDENDRHDMPQSSLRIGISDEANIPLSDETGGEGATTPLLQNEDDSYWNKEAIREAVSSFDEKCSQERMIQDVENPLADGSLTREPGMMRSSVRRKKVKHRYCKACVMVTVVWAAMIILVSVILGMDWLGVHYDQTKSESLCTLCDRNSGIGLNYSAFALPTRKPSSSSESAFVSVATINPPPENIAELCAPSILLDHGPNKVASSETLVASCATACLPAVCCVSDNDQARQALTTMLESQGMGMQAATLFSSIEGCNRGSNVARCDSYNDFCSTLYDIEHALDSMQKHFRRECLGNSEATSISTAFSRQYTPRRRSEKCNDICASLSCCYETVEPTFETERKRNREHITNYTNIARKAMEFRQIGESDCDGFTSPAGSLNAQICNTYSTAYSIFCKSQDIPRTSAPTSSSSQSSNQPSYPLTQSPTLAGSPTSSSLMPSSKTVESASSLPTISSSPTAGLVNTATSTQPSTTVPSSFIIQPSNLPTITSYPTQNSSSAETIDTSIEIPSSLPSNFSNLDSKPSQRPNFSSLPTRDVLETLNSSFLPSMMPSANDKFITTESSSPVLVLNSSQSSTPLFVNSTLTCSIVNVSIFSSLVPSLSYSHEGFCAAVEAWNTNNATTKIFAANNEMSLRHELSAFFGHLPASRELSQCQRNVTDSNGKVYCKPDAYLGGNYSDPYCSISQEEGCICGPVPESSLFPGYIESDKLFYGRGPLHLSWNYNYLEIAEVLGMDLCSRPDFVALEEAVGWASAFWSWTSIPASTGKTSAISVAEGSYGGTLNAIGGGLECQTEIYSSDYSDKVATRLDYYCNAASSLRIDKLLGMDGCENLQRLFDTCSTSGACPACRDFL